MKKTKEMEQYEKETGKFAIWRDRITEGFKKWQKGEKIYEKNKERIMILVSEETKSKWQDFIKNYDYPTISKLVREAVNSFIEIKEKSRSFKAISQISHDLKESLTIIKGYSQILLENYKDKLDWDIALKLKTIYDQSLILEEKIIKDLEKSDVENNLYDILIVEDDFLTINLLTDYFRGKGYVCKYLTSGLEAIEEMYRYVPKLVLLDILLPDIDGYEICKKMRLSNTLKKVPIFFITAVPHSEVEEKMNETGANGYFLKPFDFSKFETIFNHLK
ncbi:MAG: response regulator [Promethearchaeota archaeon]